MRRPVDVDDASNVRLVTLNRPKRRNALDSAMLAALDEVFDDAQSNPDVRAVVLTGAGPAFCAGLDLDEIRSTGANRRPKDTGRGPLPLLQKPLLGAINGPAVTGGLELALRCHLRVAADRASFADTHIQHGLVPRWGMTALLPAAVGFGAARYLSLTGRFIGAEEALSLGLVQRVVPASELLETALGLAADIAQQDSQTLQRVLALYREAESAELAPGLHAELRETVDRIAAF